MRTLVITASCIALAVLLTSFVPRSTGDGASPTSSAAISTLDLTLAAGRLARPDYADAH
jgi:hypothetical protein